MVRSVKEIDHVMNVGQKNRSVGATLMNQESSRSHSIFSITVETSQEDPANPKVRPTLRVHMPQRRLTPLLLLRNPKSARASSTLSTWLAVSARARQAPQATASKR